MDVRLVQAVHDFGVYKVSMPEAGLIVLRVAGWGVRDEGDGVTIFDNAEYVEGRADCSFPKIVTQKEAVFH